eukprot:138093-Prymnesium_polylepis.1
MSMVPLCASDSKRRVPRNATPLLACAAMIRPPRSVCWGKIAWTTAEVGSIVPQASSTPSTVAAITTRPATWRRGAPSV